MKKELPKVYEPQEVEARVYETWERSGCFKGRRDPKKKPFTIVRSEEHTSELQSH